MAVHVIQIKINNKKEHTKLQLTTSIWIQCVYFNCVCNFDVALKMLNEQPYKNKHCYSSNTLTYHDTQHLSIKRHSFHKKNNSQYWSYKDKLEYLKPQQQ